MVRHPAGTGPTRLGNQGMIFTPRLAPGRGRCPSGYGLVKSVAVSSNAPRRTESMRTPDASAMCPDLQPEAAVGASIIRQNPDSRGCRASRARRLSRHQMAAAPFGEVFNPRYRLRS